MWTTIGHDWALELLSRALVQGRLAHTYLVSGPEHIGKTHLALELATAINCRGDNPPCHQCPSCSQTSARRHPDLAYVAPDPDRIHIAQVRDLAYQLALSPLQGDWRVCVVRDVDRATPEAANALLKTLEEPPSHAILILTVSDASLLLPTIVSRCQVLTLRAVSPATIERALAQRGVEPSQARLLARLSAGRIGWAIAAAESPQMLERRNDWIDELLTLLESGRATRLARAEALSRSKALPEMLKTWEQWWRDVMIFSADAPEGCVNIDRLDALERLASSYGPQQSGRCVAQVLDTQRRLDQNANARLALEVLLLSWRRHRPDSGAPGVTHR